MTDAEIAERLYAGLTDAEVALIALALNSGACVASTPMTAGFAGKVNDLLFTTMATELRRREIDTNGMAVRLIRLVVDRAVEAVQGAAPSPPAGDAPPPAAPPGEPSALPGGPAVPPGGSAAPLGA